MRLLTDLNGSWDFITEGGAVTQRVVSSCHHWMEN